MDELFLKIVNMSISASWLVLAVIALRLVLKKAPKWVNVTLWGLVALRLLCPFSLESALSLIPSAETISPEIMLDPTPAIDSGIPAVNSVVNPIIAERYTPNQLASANPLQIQVFIYEILWGIGIFLLVCYTAISYWRLRRRVHTAVRYRDNIFQSENVFSPFVLGIIRPKIYLPFSMSAQDMTHVIAHEQAHIRRRDHWWKPLGFLLLTLHWFNPLMWLAYILLCRDIELACDEKVIKELGTAQRADYSQALLSCSVHRGMIAACPLAFGEVGVKTRVKNVLNYKKPAFWIIVIAITALIITAVCFVTDPISEEQDKLHQITHQQGYQITAQENADFSIMFYKHWLPEDILTEEGHTFGENEIVLYETDTSTMYLSHAGFDGLEQEYLIFTFDFSYDLPEAGTILLPYQVNLEDGETETFTFHTALASKDIMDSVTDHIGAAYLRGQGPGEKFCVNIKTEVYQAAEDFLSLELSGFHLLSYVPDNGVAEAVNKHYRVEEVVYQHPAISTTVTPETAPLYSFSADFSLMSMSTQAADPELNGWTQLGTMAYTTLTETNFDDHFEVYETVSGWRGELSAEQLRRENKNAWYGNLQNNVWDTAFYFLQQKNGDIYLVQARSETGVIQRIYKLAPKGPGAVSGEAVAKNYVYSEADFPFRSSIALYNNGTFVFHQNPLSSYYCHGTYSLTDETLILKTYDGLYTYSFAVEGDSLVYSAHSDLPEELKSTWEPQDGAVFTLLDEVIIKTVLSLNDVITLSRKGDDLTWSDFEDYVCEDVGSGLYIYSYEINSVFSLSIGGGSLEEKPMYIRLVANASGDYIDIREEDVTAFISKHSSDLREAAISNAVLDHFVKDENDGLFHTESHMLLANEQTAVSSPFRRQNWVAEETVYLLVWYESYRTNGIAPDSVSGTRIPTAITFNITETGEYILQKYWEPRDGSYYDDDIREKFPEGAEAVLADAEANSEILKQENTEKALAYMKENLPAPEIATPEGIVNITEVVLELAGKPLVSVTNENVDKLQDLFSRAQWIGYEPQTYFPGPDLILVCGDGTRITAALDLYDDGCMIDGRYFDYGPGMDGGTSINATPALLSLLGLSDWPEEVYDAYRHIFEPPTVSAPSEPNPMFPIEDFPDNGSMVVWYPDWTMATLAGAQPLAIIEALAFAIPERVDTPAPAVEDAAYTLHIAYDSGEEYDVFYMGNDTFCLSVSGTDDVYSFVSTALRETIENAI